VVDLVPLPEQLMMYVLAAIRAYEGAVLDEAVDRPTDATAALGRRLLQHIFPTHQQGEPLPGPLADAVDNLEDKDTVAALRLAIRKALAADPQLRTDVEGMLIDAGATIDQPPAPAGNLSQSLIGQAAVGVTLVAAFIYAGGALTLIFKLWYLKIPWTAVLGQLPRDFIITTAFGQVILPALLLAALFTALSVWYLDWSRKRRSKRAQRQATKAGQATVTNRRSRLKRIGADVLAFLGGFAIGFLPGPVVFGAVFLLLALILNISERYVPPDLLRDSADIYIACGACVLFAIVLIVCIYKLVYPSAIGNPAKHILSTGIFMIALLPAVAAVSAATLLPTVTLCGPSFHRPIYKKDANGQYKKDANGHVQIKKYVNWVRGDLIGSNSESIFIAQWNLNSPKSMDRIEVVPKSMVKAEIIGSASTGSCTDVTKPRPTPTPSKSKPEPTPTPSKAGKR
jgi:hypothetical protein